MASMWTSCDLLDDTNWIMFGGWSMNFAPGMRFAMHINADYYRHFIILLLPNIQDSTLTKTDDMCGTLARTSLSDFPQTSH